MIKHLRKVLAVAIAAFALSAYAQSEVTTVFYNDFSEFTNGSETQPGTTDISGYSGALYKSTKFPKWNGKKVYEAGEKLLIGDNGNLQTSPYKMSDFGGVIKVSMKLRARDSYGAMVNIDLRNTNVKQVILNDDKWTDISFVCSGGSYSSFIKVSASFSVNGVLIDDLKVEQCESFFPAPVAQQPTIANKTSFTAKWKSVSGATNYLLDVYSKTDAGKEYFMQNENVGNATSKSVSGLDASKEYYFTVRAQKGEVTSEPSEEIRVVPVYSSFPAPVATEASNINLLGFTANWNAVENAAYYTVALEKHTILKNDQEVTLISEDFSKVTEGSFNDIKFLATSGNLDSYTQQLGWTQHSAAIVAGMMGIAPFSNDNSFIQTPVLDLSSSNGAFKVTVDAAENAYGRFSAGDFKIQLIDSDNETVLEEKDFTTAATGFTNFVAEFTKGNANFYVRFKYAGSSKLFIDNVNVSQVKPAGSKITKLQEVVETPETSHQFSASFDNGNSYYTYYVIASVETIIYGEIGYLDSNVSNIITVADPSSVEEVEAKSANVYAANGIITVNTPNAANVEVYALTGALIYKANVEAGISTINANTNGVVIVKVNDKSFKVIL